MFDTITQTVDTKNVANALKALSGIMLTEAQLSKKKVVDESGAVHFICPGIITRITTAQLYEPKRTGSKVFYITGEAFAVDLATPELAKQLGIE